MARRYKPLPAGAVVWFRQWQCTAEVISDDGAGLVYVLERVRAYDYQTHKRRSQIRPATAAEKDAHRKRVAQLLFSRKADQQMAQLVAATLDELAAAASVTPTPADPAG